MMTLKHVLDLYVLITERKDKEIIGGLDRSDDVYYQEAQIINHTDDTLYVIDANDKEYTVKPVYRGGSFETEKIIIRKRIDLEAKRVNEDGEECRKNTIEEVVFPYRKLLNKPIYVDSLNVIICNASQKREGAIHPIKLSNRIFVKQPKDHMEKVLNETYSSFGGFFIVANDIHDITDTVYFEQAGKICSFPVQRGINNSEPGIEIFWKDEKTNQRFSKEFFTIEDIKEAKGYPLKTEITGLFIGTDKSRLEQALRERNHVDTKAGYYTLKDLEKELQIQATEFGEKIAELKEVIADYKEKIRIEKLHTTNVEKFHKTELIKKDQEILDLKNKISETQVLVDRYEKSFLAEAKLKGLNNDLAEVSYKEKKINFDDKKMEKEYLRDDIKYRREDERWEKEEEVNEKLREHKETISSSQVTKETMSTASAFVKSLAIIIPVVAGLGIWSVLKSKGVEEFLCTASLPVLSAAGSAIVACTDTAFDIADKVVSPVASTLDKVGSSVGGAIEGALDSFAGKMRCWFF
jgi:hypothetical protein